MADSPGCCSKTKWELLVDLLELDQAIFDRLDQVIQAASGGGSSDSQGGSQAIGAGVDTVSVVFPVPFVGVPSVVATMSRPVGGDMLQVNLDEASITAAGFTASLSDVTPNANYKLKWVAIL